jgi:hypothetical protein
VRYFKLYHRRDTSLIRGNLREAHLQGWMRLVGWILRRLGYYMGRPYEMDRVCRQDILEDTIDTAEVLDLILDQLVWAKESGHNPTVVVVGLTQYQKLLWETGDLDWDPVFESIAFPSDSPLAGFRLVINPCIDGVALG